MRPLNDNAAFPLRGVACDAQSGTASSRRGVACEALTRLAAARAPQAAPLRKHQTTFALDRWIAAAVGLLTLAGSIALHADEPYRNLRDATLEYTGPAEDFTNLTELRLGWFGPSDPADPLTGDVWFAANLAINEANAATDLPRSGTPCAPSVPPPGSVSTSENSDLSSSGTLRVPSVPSASSPGGGAGFPPASGTGLQTRDLPAIAPQLPFRLIPRWAGDPWRAGVSQLTRMVYDEQPLALLGSVDSASTHLAEQVVAKAQLPLVSPFTTDKSLTLAGVSWMFAFAPSDAAIARTLVDAVLATDDIPPVAGPRSGSARPPAPAPQSAIHNPKSEIVLLSATDHESRLTAREVMREFSRRSHLPDSRFELTPNLPIPPQIFEAFDQAGPSAVVIVASAEDSARWLTTLRQRLAARPAAGTAAPIFFGSHTFGRNHFLELAGPAAEGVQFPLLWNPEAASPAATAFVTRFGAARGHTPDYAAVYTYDATRLLVSAIRQAGPNRARIREALISLSPWSGLAGPVHFDGTGQNTKTTIPMALVRDGTALPLTLRSPSSSVISH